MLDVAALLERDAALGIALVLDLVAGEPRIKPSRGLLIDPSDAARRAWERRVEAVAALIASSAVVRVYDELLSELRESSELAVDVLQVAEPHADLSGEQRAELLALRADR